MKKEQDRKFIKILKRFFKPALEYKYISMRVFLPSVGGSFIGILAVYLLKDITNGISEGFGIDMYILLGFFVLLILVHYFIILITRNWIHGLLRPTYRKYMYKRYINEFTYLDNNEAEKQGTGKLIAMIDKGMHSWVDLLVRVFLDVLPNITFVLFSLIFIGLINVYYVLMIIFLFSLIFVLTYFVQRKTMMYRRKRIDSNIGIMRRFVKVLMAKFEILQNEKGENEYKKISKDLDYNIALNIKMRNLGVLNDISIRMLIDGSKIFVILLFGIGFGTSVINFGEFVSLMSVVYILDQILTKSIYLYVDFTKIFTDVEKLWNFFDNTGSIKGYNKGKKFEYNKGKIEVKDLSFYYEKTNPVFNNFNVKFKGEKVTALVGNSGSGKSTLVKLISGYIRATKGDIVIDGQKINKTSLKSYYKYIGYLTQEPSVFDGTILENLTYAVNRKLEKKEIEKIIKLSKCEFVYDLKDGINTEIGERGVRLSGGQKQRLAIAKLFLKDSKIIILDEPTSALDSFSEEQITKAMHNLFKGRTVIIIAHRLQTVKNADEIILLSNGKIKERGTHSELVKLKGEYGKMLKLQSGF